MLLDDTFGGNGKQPNLEEFVFIEDNTKEMEKEEEIAVKMKSLVSCNQSEFDCESDKELKHHMDTNHSTLDCANCNFKPNEETFLKDHAVDCNLRNKTQDEVNIETLPNSETEASNDNVDVSTVICGVCNAAFCTTLECEEHIKTHKSFRCNECKIDFNTKLEHEGHTQMNHTDEQVKVQYIECQRFDYKSENSHDLDIHRQLNHMSVTVSVDQSKHYFVKNVTASEVIMRMFQ